MNKPLKLLEKFAVSAMRLLCISSCCLPLLLHAVGKATDKPLSRIAFGSCNNHEVKTQFFWGLILKQKPDLWVWLGDAIYADTNDPQVMATKYKQQKENPFYQDFQKAVPILGTWDDHDYGINNGNKSYPMREKSQQLFLDFLNEAPLSPRRKQAGVYASSVYGPKKQAVKIILLDNRYHADSPGPNADILGEEQWQWLERELRSSKAKLNFIFSGTQIIASQHKYEKWANFPRARERLLRLIKDSKIAGVVLVSGDRHFAEISRLPASEGPLPYPLYDITASGLTHSFATFPGEPNKHRISRVFTGRNYGLLTIDWQKRQLFISVFDEKNKAQITQKISFAEILVK